MVTMEQGEGWDKGMVGEIVNNMYPLLYLKQITNKDLLYHTGNTAKLPVITELGKYFEK